MKKFLLIVLCLFVVAGCSSKSQGERDSGYRYESPSYQSASDGDAYYSSRSNSSSYTDIKSGEVVSDDKYVYTGTISFETTAFDDFYSEFNSILAQNGGVTESYNERGNGTSGKARYLTLVIRVPSKNFDRFINALQGSKGNIVSLSTMADNITKQYNSNDIRIQALEKQYNRLLELLDTAKDISEIIVLEERLSQVEMELTELNNYKNQMDADVAYSTITVYINEVVTYTETNSFWDRIKNAVSGSLRQFVNSAEEFVIDVIYFIPTLIVLIILFFALRKPVGKMIAGVAEKRAERKKKKEPETAAK